MNDGRPSRLGSTRLIRQRTSWVASYKATIEKNKILASQYLSFQLSGEYMLFNMLDTYSKDT